MGKKINIKNLTTGYQSLITNGRHAIVGDEPTSSTGTDLGFSPEDLILSSIALCKVATVRYIARKNKWEIGEVDGEFELNVKRGEDGKLSSHVTAKIKIKGDLTAEQKTELLKQADACYVHRMIEGDWDIENAVELTEKVLV
ncbi:OsmC family protein [Flavobacterium frigoris]|uniref:Redox protein, regulator of disulfide bond formation n=1 Tax=Flavobacterium frigoris (strain PS1) TaxID=1086011 RepID=H7FPW7_FLAFP|nr:OsmC family protein [Flavobacterium frigoris]EIA09321.1 putative redox protein, regulator of disulfide bond formation [Flavobacterium frigoris PS1]